MKRITHLVSILSMLLMVSQTLSTEASKLTISQLSKVIKAPGTYASPNVKCQISLNISEKGGFMELLLQPNSHQRKTVNDVTGVAYFSDNSLVYATSPIYGKPGIFVYDCTSKKIGRVVGPKKIDKAYPKGADYFELHSLEGRKIYFYYSPDVDQIDFDTFRTKEFLFEVLLDGSAIKKTSTPLSIGVEN